MIIVLDLKCKTLGGKNLLYLLGIFVANENDNRVDVNAVKAFHGVRSDV